MYENQKYLMPNANGIRIRIGPYKEMNALWQLFSPKFCQYFKTAILTMGNDILTMTMVKHYSLDGNVTDILVNHGGKVSQ